jgi:hypothetical protein
MLADYRLLRDHHRFVAIIGVTWSDADDFSNNEYNSLNSMINIIKSSNYADYTNFMAGGTRNTRI